MSEIKGVESLVSGTQPNHKKSQRIPAFDKLLLGLLGFLDFERISLQLWFCVFAFERKMKAICEYIQIGAKYVCEVCGSCSAAEQDLL